MCEILLRGAKIGCHNFFRFDGSVFSFPIMDLFYEDKALEQIGAQSKMQKVCGTKCVVDKQT